MNKPLISVIMSVYNDYKYLEKSILSVLNQTYTNFEFIIINDGSTDQSREIIEQYKKKDNRISVITHNDNKGLAESLNEGILKAKGKFIARHDSDDLSLPNRFEIQVGHLLFNQEIKMIGSYAIVIDELDKEIGTIQVPKNYNDILNTISKRNPFIHPSILIDREAVIDVGLYNPKFKRVQDYDLWFRMVEKYKCENLNLPLIKYRITKESMKKKEIKYRIIECKIRYKGIRRLKRGLRHQLYTLKPLIAAVIPKKMIYYYYKQKIKF